MNLFYFNYSHELALANDRVNYYSPVHVRCMERDLMPLATWLAHPDDVVAVAEDRVALCRDFYAVAGLDACQFVPADSLPSGYEPCTWGFDRHVVWQMRKNGAGGLPSDETLRTIRALSSRRLAVELLVELRNRLSDEPLCGESFFCQSEDEISAVVSRFGRTVLKAPLSGSGRGLRFAESCLSEPLTGWLKNTLKTQGGIVVEPFLEGKVHDLACEFVAGADGTVRFVGLSLFFISGRCSYEGNLLASQSRLRHRLFEGPDAFPEPVFNRVAEELRILLQQRLGGQYAGPLGVDMMLVRDAEDMHRLHPCVEINLRHTMGHVALHLSQRLPAETEARFSIDYNQTSGELCRIWKDRSPFSFSQDASLVDEPFSSVRRRWLLTPLCRDTNYVAYVEV